MDIKKIGKFIAENRKKQKLTQQELADKLGVTYKAVSKWETGNGLPDVSLYQDLCKEINISLNELFEGKKLTNEELVEISDKNTVSLIMTRQQIESLQVLTEFLIFAGIVVSISLTSFIAITNLQKTVTVLIGVFIWGYGLLLRVKLRNILNGETNIPSHSHKSFSYNKLDYRGKFYRTVTIFVLAIILLVFMIINKVDFYQVVIAGILMITIISWQLLDTYKKWKHKDHELL